MAGRKLPRRSRNHDVENQQEAIPTNRYKAFFFFVRYSLLSTYRRIFTIIFVANLAALIPVIVFAVRTSGSYLLTDTLTAASINLTVAVLIRQEHVVNGLFLLSSALSSSAPLCLRRRLAKVYSYGGVHSGCGIGAAFWYGVFAALFTRDLVMFSKYSPKNIAVGALTYLTVIMISIILFFAYPTMRVKTHNTFEATHRFAGWTVVAFVWSSICVQASQTSSDDNIGFSKALVATPPFWCFVIILVCLIYPWLRLRQRSFVAEKLSPHAIRLYFDYDTPEPCLGVRLSTSPLTETHAFATIPNLQECIKTGGDGQEQLTSEKAKGFSVVISNAGDWTSSVINNPPASIYTKGAPVYGVPRIAVMFRRVLFITTGSGIGPCLSHFQGHLNADTRILWSTRKPLETYGPKILQAVRKADSNASIMDTTGSSRPDLVALGLEIFRREDCEAAVIISNAKVTKAVVYGLEVRGVPAFGPIFDS